MNKLEYLTEESDSLVVENWNNQIESQVAWSTWNSVWIGEDHLVRLNITEWPIVEQYREGKVKRTPGGEWKEHETINLQPVEGRLKRLTACLLKNEPATYSQWQVKVENTGAIVKASLNRACVTGYRPEPGWSNHGQVEA